MTEHSRNGYTVLSDYDACQVYYADSVRFYLRPDACGWLLNDFARRFDTEVENLDRTDCHGFSKRKIAGSADWSNHASGTAVDLNATQHPSGRADTFSHTEQENLRDLLDYYDGAIRWGGDYRSGVDEMHFEINENLFFVQMVKQKIGRNYVVYTKKLKPGNRNIDVYMVKRELHNRGYVVGALNKYFGNGLTKAYSQWQQSLGYTGADADGVPGPASLRALGLNPK